MKTTGQILQSTRLEKKLEYEDVSRVTKIRADALKAIEADDYQRLPSGAVAKGFIRNYAEFLDLNPNYILAIFRRDFIENQLGQIVPRGMVEPVERFSFWTPKTTIVAVITLMFTLFGAYLFYQYTLLIGPPLLEVSQPPQDQSVTDSSIEVFGKTDPEATISVNGQLVALEKGGLFSFRIPLNQGENSISIVATSKSGKTSTVTRKITLTNPTQN